VIGAVRFRMLATNWKMQLALLAAITMSGVAAAQQPASAAGKGTVTGQVSLGDSRLPARFAQVVLYGVPAQVTSAPKPNPDADAGEMAVQIASALKSLSNLSMSQAQSGIDGSYVVSDVTPGDYYVFAAAPGYITPLNQVQALLVAGADMKKPLPGITVIHVAADRTSTIDVEMPKGAAISGTVSWSDGSPVAGAIMAAIPAKGDAPPMPQQFNMLAMASVLSALSITDDLGHFRISSLAPGDYFVTATIRTGQQMGLGASMNLGKMMAVTPLVVYGPSGWHKSDGKAIALRAGEDHGDAQFTLDLGHLHSVSGRVSALTDHHGINSGTVRLTDAFDKDFSRTASLDAAGNFTIEFVPPGSYDMTVSNAEDTEPAKKNGKKVQLFSDDTTLRSYQKGKSSVVVLDKDVTDQNIELAIDTAPKTEPDIKKMMGDEDSPDPK
jgi:hypothetical protein